MKRPRLVTLAALFAATLAVAHAPARLRPGEPFVVEKPTISYAAFGEFVTGDEVFVLKVNFGERFGTPLEMLVPCTAALAAHRPAWAVVGPDLPPPGDAERAALPKELPPGLGAIVDLGDAPNREVIFESVMRRFYWSSGALAVVFPQGDSEVWIWAPGKTKGKFGLGLGVEEGGGYMAAFKDWAFYAY